ncbi:hypothetical protein BO71DRAFT_473278, partial [Aspergillus ellipticus CBS 707.79]
QLLTGATGSLGSHIAAQLSLLPNVHKIYCLIRATSPIDAYTRLHASLQHRRLYSNLSPSQKSKLIALPSPTLNHPTLSLPSAIYTTLLTETTDIIHSAWSVNFNLHLTSLAQENLPGLSNLLTLALTSHRPTPPSFNFCSSVSAVVNTPESISPIPESLPASLSAAQSMGYAQSKLVAEHITANAAAASSSPTFPARILRIGQVIGDTTHGIWNPSEAIPLIFQSATTVGALPKLDESPRWLPVDVVARAVVDISLADHNPSHPPAPSNLPEPTPNPQTREDPEKQLGNVYNIVNPTPFHWTTDLLPQLRAAGLDFEALEPKDWVARLRSVDDPVRNPPVKLAEFFREKYAGEKGFRSLVYETGRARAVVGALGEVEGLEEGLVGRMVGWFKGVGWKA